MKEDYPNDNPRLFQVATKAIITNPNREVLLLEVNTDRYHSHYGPHWDLPGGRIKDNSTFEQNLQREVEEEMGISKIQIGEIFDISRATKTLTIDNQLIDLIFITYLCQADTSQITLSHEHKSFNYFSPTQAAELLKVKFSESLCTKIAKL